MRFGPDLCAVLAMALLPPAGAWAQSPLAATIDALVEAPAVRRAHWGISVVDAATGAPLYSKNEAQLFEPASNAKLFTTAAALAILGPNATLTTIVRAEPGTTTTDGVLHGNLRLIGAGDPTLSGRVYPYAGKTERADSPLRALDDLAAQVAASGIHSVDGAVIGDDTLFVDEHYGAGWAWDDLQWDYGAPVSALSFNDNVAYLTINPGAHAGGQVALAWNPDLSAANRLSHSVFAVDNQIATAATGEAADHLGVNLEPGTAALHLYGTVRAGTHPPNLAIAVPDGAAYAAQAFTAALTAHSVTVSGEAQAAHRENRDTELFAAEVRMPLGGAHALPPVPNAAGRVVATHTSPPLKDIATVTNKVSQNLHAELLLRLLGRARGDDGSVAQGARVVRSFLLGAGVDSDDFTFHDGSGLSPDDLVTPRAITTLLVYAARQGWGGVYRTSLPVGGVDGSLSGRFTQPAMKGKLQAKTGTLGEVNALSGYLTAASGRQLVFSVIVNDRVGDAARVVLDKVVAAIAAAY